MLPVGGAGLGGIPYGWRDILTLPQVTVPYWEALEIAKMTSPRVVTSDVAGGAVSQRRGDIPGAVTNGAHDRAHRQRHRGHGRGG